MATMMLATGTIITNIYKTEIDRNAGDQKVLKDIQIGNLYFCLPYPDTCISDSQSVTYQPVLTLRHVAAAPVSFSILAGLMWKRCTKQGRILEHADRHDSGDFLDASWVD